MKIDEFGYYNIIGVIKEDKVLFLKGSDDSNDTQIYVVFYNIEKHEKVGIHLFESNDIWQEDIPEEFNIFKNKWNIAVYVGLMSGIDMMLEERERFSSIEELYKSL